MPSRTEHSISRRQFLRFATAVSGTGLLLRFGVKEPLEAVGTVLDKLIPPEKYLFGIKSIAQVRTDNTPHVEYRPRNRKTSEQDLAIAAIQDTLTIEIKNVLAKTEYSKSTLQSGRYTFSGCTIVTTAPGIKNGRQEYSALFANDRNLIAIGYETGQVALLDSTTHEWEDLPVVDTPQEVTVLATRSVWDVLLKTRYCNDAVGMLLRTEMGNNILNTVDYKMFYGIKHTTRVPEAQPMEVKPDSIVNSLADALAFKKPYYVTEQGIIIDLVHITTKAFITFQWLIQLAYYAEYSKKNPHNQQKVEISTTYMEHGSVSISFNIDESNLKERQRTTMSMMHLFTFATEGIIQNIILTTARKLWIPTNLISKNSAWSPEDAFSNTTAADIAYKIFTDQKHPLYSNFQACIAKLLEMSDQLLTGQQLNEFTHTFMNSLDMKDFRQTVITALYQQYPCRAVTNAVTLDTLNLYPYNPVIISDDCSGPNVILDTPKLIEGIAITHLPNLAESLPASFTRIVRKISEVFIGARQ